MTSAPCLVAYRIPCATLEPVPFSWRFRTRIGISLTP